VLIIHSEMFKELTPASHPKCLIVSFSCTTGSDSDSIIAPFLKTFTMPVDSEFVSVFPLPPTYPVSPHFTGNLHDGVGDIHVVCRFVVVGHGHVPVEIFKLLARKRRVRIRQQFVQVIFFGHICPVCVYRCLCFDNILFTRTQCSITPYNTYKMVYGLPQSQYLNKIFFTAAPTDFEPPRPRDPDPPTDLGLSRPLGNLPADGLEGF